MNVRRRDRNPTSLPQSRQRYGGIKTSSGELLLILHLGFRLRRGGEPVGLILHPCRWAVSPCHLGLTAEAIRGSLWMQCGRALVPAALVTEACSVLTCAV